LELDLELDLRWVFPSGCRLVWVLPTEWGLAIPTATAAASVEVTAD
jgi:hypothetical protein